MKHLILVAIATLSLAIVSCGNNNATDETTAHNTLANGVEVLYFHGKQRCAGCMAIEQETKNLIDSVYATEVQNGTLLFNIVDIDENEALADEYQVAWSSLIVVEREAGEKKEVIDLTDFAFETARSNPDEFKEGLANEIKQRLNN